MTSVIIFVIGLGLIAVFLQNRLAGARTRVEATFSGIEVQLKRRHDLVPALVKTARQAMHQESAIFDKVLAAREKAISALGGDLDAISAAEAELSQGLQGILGYAEDTPELGSMENLRTLQGQLEETEDQISAARRLYNVEAQRYNAMLAAIPSNWIAGAMRYEPARYFELGEGEAAAARRMPEIDLGS
ncbi:LemA family protein [Roseovarius salinarum]|uniref:LemA family protein n=1 Tax=Roseovarius salinarum TaxID=1981892 RepID=UPI0012FFFAF2|nr:LemA family protein [Roseovarius salinarum]